MPKPWEMFSDDPEELIRRSAAKYGTDPKLLRATAKVESNFNPKAVSKAGAQGAMQLMPATAKSLGVKDPFDMAQSIDGAAKLQGQLNLKYKGDRSKIAAAYNAGEPAVDKAGGVPNFPETQDYVKKIDKEYGAGAKPWEMFDDNGSESTSLEEILHSKTPGAQGAIERGIGGAFETMMPTNRASDVPEGIGYAIQHPLDSAALVGGSLLQSHLDEFSQAGQKFKEALQEPNWSDKVLTGIQGLGHGLAGMVPGVGPAVAQGAERIGGEDTARGVGNLVGIAAPIAMGKAGAMVEREKPVGRVPLTYSERTGSAKMGSIEGAVERSLMGSDPFKNFRTKQQMALNTWSDDIVNQISKYKGSNEDLGGILQKNVEVTKGAMKQALRAEYAKADAITDVKVKRVTTTQQVPSQTGLVNQYGQPVTVPQKVTSKAFVGGIQPATQPLKRIAAPMLRDLQRQEMIMDKTQLATYKQDLQAIIKAPATVPFQTMQDFRSDMLSIARSLDEPIPGKRAGLARALSAAADKSMETAAANSKNPEVMKIIRDANAGYKYMAETFNESLVSKLLKTAPEKAHLLLKTGDLDGIRRIKASVTPDNFQAMKSHLVQDMLNDATRNEIISAPSAQLSNVPQEQRVLKGNTFSKSLEKFGQERLDTIFNKSESSELMALAKTAEKIQTKSGHPIWGWILNAPLLYGVGEMAGAPFGGPTKGIIPMAGLAGSTRIVAEIMTKPEGIKTIRGLINNMGDPRGQAAVFYGTKLSQLMQNEADKIGKKEPPSPPWEGSGVSP